MSNMLVNLSFGLFLSDMLKAVTLFRSIRVNSLLSNRLLSYVVVVIVCCIANSYK